MGRDANIYVYSAKFPYEKLGACLELFEGWYESGERKYQIDFQKIPIRDGGPYCDEWVIYENERNDAGNVFISLHAFTDNYRWNFDAPRPDWSIGLHWSGSGGTELNLERIIPFAAFFIFDKIIFYERQWDQAFFSANEYMPEFIAYEIKDLDSFKLFLINKGKCSI